MDLPKTTVAKGCYNRLFFAHSIARWTPPIVLAARLKSTANSTLSTPLDGRKRTCAQGGSRTRTGRASNCRIQPYFSLAAKRFVPVPDSGVLLRCFEDEALASPRAGAYNG